MGEADNQRGIANRGTANRITIAGPGPGMPQKYPPFSLELLGLFGQEAIPNALAYALKWQLDLDRLDGGPPEAQRELALELLALEDFLLTMEAQVERDPRDGALLYRDAIAQFGATRFDAHLVELSDGRMIPLGNAAEPPLPVWAPSVFPLELSSEARARYPKRPKALAQIPPFDAPELWQSWLRMSAWQPPPEASAATTATTGPAVSRSQPRAPLTAPPGTVIAPLPAPAQPVDGRALEAALDKAAAEYDDEPFSERKRRKYATPLVSDAIRQLTNHTLLDLRDATGASLSSPYEDDKLIEHTEIILYHSVHTVVLDRHGNPFDLRIDEDHEPLLPYALLLPDAGSQMRRALPQPGGVNVSVQRYGDSTFRIQDGTISKVLFGGVGAFAEYGYGYTGKHELQVTLEQFLVNRGRSYIASVTAEAGLDPEEATVSRIYLRLSDLAEVATPYVVEEISARADKMFENWREYAAIVLEETIKSVILDAVRNRVRDYLIKKIGKRIVPVINAAFAVYDLVSGGAERTRMRYAIQCAVLAIKGRTGEDTELAAKVVSKVMADEFESKVIEKLIEHAAKTAKKTLVRRAAKRKTNAPSAKTAAKDGGEASARAQTAPDPAHADASGKQGAAAATPEPPAGSKRGAGNAAASTAGVDHNQPVKQSSGDAEAARQHQEYVRQKFEEAVRQSKAEAAPARAKPDAAADVKAVNDTGATAHNRGVDDPAKSTAPEKKREKKQKVTPEYWPGTGLHGPPTREQMGLGPQRPSSARRRRSASQDPPEPTVSVKPEEPPEDLDDVRDTANVRTSSVKDEALLRSEREKARGATALGHDSHHTARKRGGRARGERIRELLRIAGVSVNDEANENEARGLPRDPRAPHESSSQHWGLHTEENQKQLLRELQTVRGDPDATRAVLRRHGLGYWDDRKLEELEFVLGPDVDDPDPDDE